MKASRRRTCQRWGLRGLVWLCAVCAAAFLGRGRPPALAQDALSIVIENLEVHPNAEIGGTDVIAHVSVTGSDGTPIQGLTAANFMLRQDGSEIADYEVSPSVAGISLVLAVDTSGSMAAESKMQAVKLAVEALIQGLGDEDQVGLISFNDQYRVEINVTGDTAAVQNFVALLEPVPDAGTCLWDAAYEAVELASAAQQGRRAVVLLTDGIDERSGGGVCSEKTLEDVVGLATDRSVRVPVYTVGVGNRINGPDLARLADLTGGRAALAEDAAEIAELFGRLGVQLRGGYILRYRTGAASGEHSLFVQVENQGMRDQDVRNFRTPELPARLALLGVEDGQTIQGETAFSAAVSGEASPARVAIYLDGALTHEDNAAPFDAEVACEGLDAGAHVLRAVAFDDTGEVIGEAEVSLRCLGAVPTEAPPPPAVSIAFSGLQSGQTIRDPAQLGVLVQEGETDVRRVAFYVDAFLIGEDAEAPFAVTWVPEYVETGEHILSAVAYGEANRVLARDDITVAFARRSSLPMLLGVPIGVLTLAAVGYLAYRRVARRGREAPTHGVRVPGDHPRIAASTVLAEPPGEQPLAQLTVEACQDESLVGRRFEIREEQALIGRSEQCAVGLPVQPVSRVHAVLRLKGGQVSSLTVDDLAKAEATPDGADVRFWIFDGDPAIRTGSTFGTYVDNVRVLPGLGLPLRDGCRVRLGRPLSEGRVMPVILRFQDLRPSPGGPVEAGLTRDGLALEQDKPGEAVSVEEGRARPDTGTSGFETEELHPLRSLGSEACEAAERPTLPLPTGDAEGEQDG